MRVEPALVFSKIKLKSFFSHVVPSPHTKGKGVKILPPRSRVPLEITFVLALVDPSQREDVDVVALGA